MRQPPFHTLNLIGNPLMGHPLMGHPLMGHPLMGHPLMGHPLMGHPLMGHPLMGHPLMGHPPLYVTPLMGVCFYTSLFDTFTLMGHLLDRIPLDGTLSWMGHPRLCRIPSLMRYPT